MNDLVMLSTIERLAESGRTIERLRRMPPTELESLLELLSDSASVEALRQLLVTVRQLQRSGGKRVVSVGESLGRRKESAGEIEAVLGHILSDRQRFRTVGQVSEFVQEVFGMRVPSAKASRERYVKRVLQEVRGNPKALYHARNVIAHSDVDKKDRAYATLYNFIRGRLTE